MDFENLPIDIKLHILDLDPKLYPLLLKVDSETRKYYSGSEQEKVNRREYIKEKNKKHIVTKTENYYLLNGKKDGPYIRKYENGNIDIEVSYIKGKREGQYKTYYENGNIYGEGNYIDGKLDGPQKKYYQNGDIYEEENYTNGKLEDYKLYY